MNGFEPTIVEELAENEGGKALPAAEDRPLQSLPTIGYVGRYALKYQLGVGGLGSVHAAIDPLLSRPLAIKTLHLTADNAQRADLEALLLHEARAAAGLNHPHIVTVYDAGLAEEGVYIAMERLQGRDLRHLLAEGWRPEPRQAAQIVRRVADALAYAHSKGVVHCDIKPANIFMVGRTQPKVLDFGIARVAHAQTLPGAPALPAGSPYYMPPEQLDEGGVDARSDVYALGVVLYELLTGRRPFDGGSLDEIAAAVRQATPVPPHELQGAVPLALSEVCARAMSRDPSKRHRSARALSRALRGVLDGPILPHAHRSRRPSTWTVVLVGLMASGLFMAWRASERMTTTASARASTITPAVSAATTPPSASPAPMPSASSPLMQVAAAEAAEASPSLHAMAAAPTLRPARDKRKAAREVSTRAAPGSSAAPAAAPQGTVQIAVSPWGEVDVDGARVGVTPPLTRLQLPAGSHVITLRNGDFPPRVERITVSQDQPVLLRHRFGS